MQKYFFGKPVRVFQGDTREFEFEIANVSLDDIDKVYFTCKKAGLQFECSPSDTDGVYRLRLQSEETEMMSPVITTYDVSVKLKSGGLFTSIFEGEFAVLKKRNPVDIEETEE